MTTTSSSPFESRLSDLRDHMRHEKLDGFLVPMTDAYQNEYVPASDARVAFLTGFTGSAGCIVVMQDRAAFFTDGRYTIQASQQIDNQLFSLHDTADTAPSLWMVENVGPDQTIGFDPWLHSIASIERLRHLFQKNKASLIPVDTNPIDAIWCDRPFAPAAPVVAHDLAYAGESTASKRAAVAAVLCDSKHDAAVLTDPASIAWLLNVRGNDVPHAPLPLSFAICHKNERIDWFIDPRKLTTDLSAHLGELVELYPLTDFEKALTELGKSGAVVRVEPIQTAHKIGLILDSAGAKLVLDDNPCLLPKACKNATELDGMRAAHKRDAVAVTRLLAWLDQRMDETPPTEIQVEEQLETFRQQSPLYRGPSFDTIAGTGPHGAIVHYRATPETNATLERGTFLLLDSGGQYLDGTTDITRTIPLLGRARDAVLSADLKETFTLVLKGHIALARARFPRNTTGGDLDVLARHALWEKGLDYAHGTGHGVGCYLSVHEGPQSISRRNGIPLKAGMILSNEPGYYKEDHYGIRHENLVAVIPTGDDFLAFETLTLVPFDTRAIDVTLLTQPEKDWLNAYHARVFTTLLPLLDEPTVQWLKTATAAI